MIEGVIYGGAAVVFLVIVALDIRARRGLLRHGTVELSILGMTVVLGAVGFLALLWPNWLLWGIAMSGTLISCLLGVGAYVLATRLTYKASVKEVWARKDAEATEARRARESDVSVSES